MTKTETRRDTWMFTFLAILILTFFLIGTKAIAENIDVDVDTQTGVEVSTEINSQGSEIPENRTTQAVATVQEVSAPTTPVRLKDTLWIEDDVRRFFNLKPVWSVEELECALEDEIRKRLK